MRPPPQRSKEALARRAEKRGRTIEEQRALDRSVLELVAEERKGKKDAGKKTATVPQPSGVPPGAPEPYLPGGPLSLAHFIANEGRGLVGHRLECAGKCPAKVLSARAGKEADSILVKLRFDAPVASHDRDKPARRTVQLTISQADVLASRFRIADGSLADWLCAGCGFRNFGSRRACNSCHQRRFAAPAGAQGDSSASFPTRIPAAKKTNVDPKRAWEGSVVSPAQIAANKLLREQYAADPAKLSAAERERAELLISRDARKREKKSARKARLAAGAPAPGWRERKPAHTPHGRR